MSGSRFLRLTLLLPGVVTAIVWLAVPHASATPIPIMLAAGLIPYAVFVLLFLASTLSCSEPQLLLAILWAPLAFVPFLFLFILIPAVLFPDPFSGSAVLALLLAIGFGYAYVGLGLVLYYVLRRAGLIAGREML